MNRRRQPFQVFFGPKPFFNQQLNPSRWPSYCDHSVTSADVRLSVGPNLSRPARQRPVAPVPGAEACGICHTDAAHRQTLDKASPTASGRIGKWRTCAPEAAKIALPIAGATAVVAGSPSPTGVSELGRNSISTSGTSPIAPSVQTVGPQIGECPRVWSS